MAPVAASGREEHAARGSANPEDDSEVEKLEKTVDRLKEKLIAQQIVLDLYYNTSSSSTLHGAEPRDPHHQPYSRVRQDLRLNEAIVISGSAGPANCNPFCATGGKSSCRPKCVFMQKITSPGNWIDACIFNGHEKGSVPSDVRQQGCIPVAEGMESETNYPTLVKNRLNPETWMRSYRLDEEVPATYFNPPEVILVRPGPELEKRQLSASVIVSNCRPSHRNAMIETLRKYIPIAYYGRCGSSPWPSNCGPQQNQRCSKFDVMQKHVIYLAFENSVTRDYVTEKLYDGISAGCVTVAYGAPNALDLAPKGSIINIANAGDGDRVGKMLKSMLEEPGLAAAKKQAAWFHDESWRGDWEQRMGFTRLHSDCRLCDMLRRRAVIATGADVRRFEDLKATVGTLHKIERRRKIIVFDMGMTPWQLDQVRSWEDTALVRLTEYSFPGSIPWTRRTAALLWAVHAAGTALWLDPGVRIQRRIANIDAVLEREGVFVLEEAGALGDYAHNATVEWLGMAAASKGRIPLLSYSVVGFREGTGQ